jgi:hypothetical protein
MYLDTIVTYTCRLNKEMLLERFAMEWNKEEYALGVRRSGEAIGMPW